MITGTRHTSWTFLEMYLLVLLCWKFLPYSNATETNHLTYFETLSYVKVTSKVKRSSPTEADLVKRLQFHAFKRNFHLTLKSGSPVIAKDFRARMVHKDGTSTFFPIDQSKIFTGYDTYNRQSKVHAHLEESLWFIHIIAENETYAVEPAWRILSPSENPLNDTMVAYRMSDLKDINSGYGVCNAKPNSQDLPAQGDEVRTLVHHGERRVRKRRAFTDGGFSRNTCMLLLVGDTDLFRKRCKRNHFSCSSLMIQYLQWADSLYCASPFEDRSGRKHYGIGLQVQELILLTDYNNPSMMSFIRHFNENYNDWDADSKLASFATYMRLSQKRYCLNHLFTEFPDRRGVLGLAYVNQLCRWRGSSAAYNSGITSGTNRVGFLIPSLATSIVLAHEIGHNFGSHHDPDTPECAPEDSRGGKFIMWQYAVSGLSPNNKHFSKCSLRQIGRNVPAQCFQARSKVHFFCGNGIVDEGEECDAGFYGIKDDNICCSKDCTLRPGAVCSEVNHECCINCKVAPSTTVCRDTQRTFSCLGPSYCSGTSTVCLDGGYLRDGADCGEMHKCIEGICASPCEQLSFEHRELQLKPCQCRSNTTEACLWCCFDDSNPDNPGECKPVLPEPRIDGTPCFKGTCLKGRCIQVLRQKDTTRLSAYITFIQTSSFEKFLQTNIVLVVVVLSLILWVPPSLYIHSIDVQEQHLRDLLEEAIRAQAAEDDDEDSSERFTSGGTLEAAPKKGAESSVKNKTTFSTIPSSKSRPQKKALTFSLDDENEEPPEIKKRIKLDPPKQGLSRFSQMLKLSGQMEREDSVDSDGQSSSEISYESHL